MIKNLHSQIEKILSRNSGKKLYSKLKLIADTSSFNQTSRIVLMILVELASADQVYIIPERLAEVAGISRASTYIRLNALQREGMITKIKTGCYLLNYVKIDLMLKSAKKISILK